MSLSHLGRDSDWSAVTAQVLGLGVAGYAAADNLAFVGAHVVACDSADHEPLRQKARILRELDVDVRLGQPLALEPGIDLLVVSPGLPPSHPVIEAAMAAGVEVWGELELAWRLRGEAAAPWLCVTGTNGKTTTTLMLESMLRAAGLRTVAAGNIGRSLIEVVMDPDGYDVIAVEVGAPQLPFVHSVSAHSAVCLNIAEDHIDFFGSMAGYIAAKSVLFERAERAIVYNAQDRVTLAMAERAEVQEGCRAVGFTLEAPARGELGVVEEFLVDRAFAPQMGEGEAIDLATLEDVQPFAKHNVANALAAAALARSFGVPREAVRQGLIDFQPAAHRVARVAEIDGVLYVDDSKATNCHAAATAISSFDRVVWIAGGDAKGQDFSELVKASAGRLAGAVLLGRDRELVRSALSAFAPEAAVVEVSESDPTAAMAAVVAAAREMAKPGDTVLLAPACASWDMFQNYGHRGDLFTESVTALGE